MEQGKFYQLPLVANGKIVIGRRYKGYIRFYALDESTNDIKSALNEENAFLGNYVRSEIPIEGDWTLLGKMPWTMEELMKIPFLFRQNMFNYSDCKLVHPALLEAIPVEYNKCIGLERAGVYERWELLRDDLLAKLKGVPNEPWHEFYRLKIPGVDKPR
jgi:hypothetical protein